MGRCDSCVSILETAIDSASSSPTEDNRVALLNLQRTLLEVLLDIRTYNHTRKTRVNNVLCRILPSDWPQKDIQLVEVYLRGCLTKFLASPPSEDTETLERYFLPIPICDQIACYVYLLYANNREVSDILSILDACLEHAKGVRHMQVSWSNNCASICTRIVSNTFSSFILAGTFLWKPDRYPALITREIWKGLQHFCGQIGHRSQFLPRQFLLSFSLCWNRGEQNIIFVDIETSESVQFFWPRLRSKKDGEDVHKTRCWRMFQSELPNWKLSTRKEINRPWQALSFCLARRARINSSHEKGRNDALIAANNKLRYFHRTLARYEQKFSFQNFSVQFLFLDEKNKKKTFFGLWSLYRTPEIRHCPLVWRLLMLLLREQSLSQERGEEVYHESVAQCPWSRSIYIDVAEVAPQFLTQIQDVIREKDLRMHVTPEELHILRGE